ncbi:MAG TPA: hypothetical protein VGE84_11140 [Allosphingosinicella sp.]
MLLLVAACGDTKHEAPPEKPRETSSFAAPAQLRSALQPTEVVAPRKAGQSRDSAAQVAQTYFDLLEAGDYAAAWELRWESRKASPAQADAFIAAFTRYRSYRGTAGQPSQEVRAGDSLFVEVPVQIYGQLASGAPLASAGIITLRRDAAKPGAWRIYSR